MKEMVKYGLTLAAICVIASGLLATVNSVTRGKIFAQAHAEENASLKEVLPQAARFEAVKSGDNILYYKGYDAGGNPVGVAFKAAGKGYSSDIETMAGMDNNGKITAIKVISLNETPGLGSRVAEKPFTSGFAGQTADDLGNVQAITGASISSRAVINSVKAKAAEVIKLLKQ